jgi:hypothetical protein
MNTNPLEPGFSLHRDATGAVPWGIVIVALRRRSCSQVATRWRRTETQVYEIPHITQQIQLPTALLLALGKRDLDSWW